MHFDQATVLWRRTPFNCCKKPLAIPVSVQISLNAFGARYETSSVNCAGLMHRLARSLSSAVFWPSPEPPFGQDALHRKLEQRAAIRSFPKIGSSLGLGGAARLPRAYRRQIGRAHV